MVYENVIKVRGPYQGKDNRFRIMLIYNDKSSKIMSYPKYIMERHLDRYLEKDEQVDHIDGNHKNNTLDNCILLCPNCHSLTDNYKFKKSHKSTRDRRKYYKKE